MNKIEYEKGKFLVYNDNPLDGKIIDIDVISNELSLIEQEISELESILKDSKKLLIWAKEQYPYLSGLDRLYDRKKELEDDQKIINNLVEVER